MCRQQQTAADGRLQQDEHDALEAGEPPTGKESHGNFVTFIKEKVRTEKKYKKNYLMSISIQTYYRDKRNLVFQYSIVFTFAESRKINY